MEEKIVKNENYKEYYTNWIKAETSLYDIKLLFGTLIGNDEEKANIINASGKIIMSPQHAKALSEMLKDIVENYEKVFGKINIGV